MRCSEEFDVAVIGGGPAGCVAAIFLARNGFRVGLFDGGDLRTLKVGEHLPPRAVRVLKELGLREALDGQERSYGILVAWESQNFTQRSYLTESYGSGYQLNRGRFDATLQEMARRDGVSILRDHQLLNGFFGTNDWRLRFRARATGRLEVRAKLCIDATGRNAKLARRDGAMVRHHDSVTAVSQVFQLSDGGSKLTSEITIEALEYGWIYSAPLGRRKQICTLFTDDRERLRDHKTGEQTNLSRLGAATSIRLANHHPHGDSFATSASTSRLQRAGTKQWIAVGDAVTAFDPLTSYGIAAAISTGYYGAQAASDVLNGSDDAILAYSAIVDHMFCDCTERLHALYESSRRFSDCAFWVRRSASLRQSECTSPAK